MTPDLTNPYHRAYAEVFGLADVQADEWPEIEAEMCKVAAAPDADRAAYLLAGWGYHDRHLDSTAEALTQAARELRRRLGVVDAPEAGSVEEERAAVVAWLRSEAPVRLWNESIGGTFLTVAADAIARGQHRKGDR